MLGLRPLNYIFAGLFVVAYAVCVGLSIRAGGEAQKESELSPLHFDLSRRDPPAWWQLGAQLALALGAIIYGAHLFVEQLTQIAESLGVSALVLALVIARFATELPEKVNSFIWMRQGKDSLALGNITGAMVFQSSLPVSVGLVFTDWDLSPHALAACAAALAGGLVALWAGLVRGRFGLPAILAWASLFAAFVAYAVFG